MTDPAPDNERDRLHAVDKWVPAAGLEISDRLHDFIDLLWAASLGCDCGRLDCGSFRYGPVQHTTSYGPRECRYVRCRLNVRSDTARFTWPNSFGEVRAMPLWSLESLEVSNEFH